MNASTVSNEKYLRDLQWRLQLRDVPGTRIGEIVAEVEVHTADSGETAESAFGSASDYAAQFGERPGRRPTGRTWINVIAAMLGGWLAAEGFFHLLIGQPYLGVPPVALLVAGLLILGCVFALVPLNVIVDPRTNQRPRHPRLMFLGVTLVGFAALMGLIWLSSTFVG